MRLVLSNRPLLKNDTTLNFFYGSAKQSMTASLACPFFTDTKPIEILLDAKVAKVQLLIRLCEATSARAVREVRKMEHVDVRYFTVPFFHAKFYIIGNLAMVGSANLTGAGMMKNRELSLIIDSDDPRFEELPGIFDELWAAASPLTDESVENFEKWQKSNPAFEAEPISGIEEVGPQTINIASQIISKERSYLQTFRAYYEESILPAHQRIKNLYYSSSERHPFFEEYTKVYELDRFLYWAAGAVRTQDLEEVSYRSDAELKEHMKDRKSEWFNVNPENVYHNGHEVESFDRLAELCKTPENIAAMDMSELTELMSACNAFRERLRFTKGGLDPLKKKFERGNTPEQIAKFLDTLVNGSGDYAQRTYDCIFNPELKLQEWGRNSTLEIFGWINVEGIPPVNGRTTKALRALGLETKLL